MWTTEYPTKPGYYWLRNYQIDYRSHHGPIIPGPVVVEVDDDYTTWTGDEMGVYRKHIVQAEWCGPILPRQHTDRELLTKFLDYIYHHLSNKSACYVAIDSFLQIRLSEQEDVIASVTIPANSLQVGDAVSILPPEDKPQQKTLTQLFHDSLTNRGKQVLADQAIDDLEPRQ